MKLLAAFAFVSLLVAPAFADDPIRYVVASPSPNGYALWTNWVSFNGCSRALIRGGSAADVQMMCQDGFSGLKPKIGHLGAGTMVERLETTECRDMVRVRVGTGPFKGQTGCITGDALTSFKPE